MTRRLIAATIGLAVAAAAGAAWADSASDAPTDTYIAQPGDGWYSAARAIAPGADPSIAAEYLARANGETLASTLHPDRVLHFVPSAGELTPTTTTTVAPTTTTVPPTTVPPTTQPPTTTTVPPTTTTLPPTTTTSVPSGALFSENFATEAALDRFDYHVFHRNPDVHGFYGFSGGSWTGDHAITATGCAGPTTTRNLSFDSDDLQPARIANSVYWCPNGTGHMMTSMGDVDGYSIVAFSPKTLFGSVESVSFEVNLTDLGNRQWWKVGVLSQSDCPALDIRCMYSDVGAADIPSSLATSGRLIASWSGGLSGGLGGGMKIGNSETPGAFSSGGDRGTRFPVSLTDNGNGTVTFRVASESHSVPGSFPECPCRVVSYDHNYTPDKSPGEGNPFTGYTWHWDSIEIR